MNRRGTKSLSLAALLALVSSVIAHAQTGASEHVPPDPPRTRVHQMPYGEMAEMMGMDDRRLFGKVIADRLEWQESAGDGRFAWDASAWYGGDFNKLYLEAAGERSHGATAESRTELGWDRIISPWWNLRLGGRHDGGSGPTRDWASIGVAGVAPGLFEIEASFYLGEGGRTALRVKANKDYLLTQRLALQPEAELAAYGRDDPGRLIGAGLSDLELGLRLRYEIRRELAPYLGVRWVGHFGDSADQREAVGEDAHEWLLLAGLRAWY
jgi:copper resistance protein B